MRRRLLNITAAVSLVLCLATVALWVRSSFYSADSVTLWSDVQKDRYDGYRVGVYIGVFSLSADHYRFPPAARGEFIEHATSGRSERYVHRSTTPVSSSMRDHARTARLD